MCTVIVTIRTVLWYVMSLASTLFILVALFTNRWLEGSYSATGLTNKDGFVDSISSIANTISDGDFKGLTKHHTGLFLKCTEPQGRKFFDGECIPEIAALQSLFTDLEDEKYPHAWRGAVICFVLGLAFMIFTDLLALMTVCCRRCCCCSVFTFCGSIQSFASMLFILGLIAFPAGWGSRIVKTSYCAGASGPFVLGGACAIGAGFWLAVAGTVCALLSSTLAIWAYKSTKTTRCEIRQEEGDRCLCMA